MAEEDEQIEHQKWYNSRFFHNISGGIAFGVVVLSLAFAVRSCDPSNRTLEMERIKRGYGLQRQDLNKNGKYEDFYEINGTKYFSHIDGKNLEDSLKE